MAATLAEITSEASVHVDCTAFIIGELAWIYRDLDRSSDRVADSLVALDVMPGDRVSIFGANSFEWIAACCGAAKVGTVVIPLGSMLTEDELRYTIEVAVARVVIASGDKAPALRKLTDDGILDHSVAWGGERPDKTHPLDDWLRENGARFSTRLRNPEDPAVIAYTSGATGRPKGAVQSHRTAVATAVDTVLMATRTKEDRIINALSLFHV